MYSCLRVRYFPPNASQCYIGQQTLAPSILNGLLVFIVVMMTKPLPIVIPVPLQLIVRYQFASNHIIRFKWFNMINNIGKRSKPNALTKFIEWMLSPISLDSLLPFIIIASLSAITSPVVIKLLANALRLFVSG